MTILLCSSEFSPVLERGMRVGYYPLKGGPTCRGRTAMTGPVSMRNDGHCGHSINTCERKTFRTQLGMVRPQNLCHVERPCHEQETSMLWVTEGVEIDRGRRPGFYRKKNGLIRRGEFSDPGDLKQKLGAAQQWAC